MKFLGSLLLLAVATVTPVTAFAPVRSLQRGSLTVESKTYVSQSTKDDNDDETAAEDGMKLPNMNVDFSGVSEQVTRVMDGFSSNFDADQVASNVQEGTLGERGEVYFAAQAALVVCIVLGDVPVVGEPLRVILGPTLLLAGIAASLLSVVDLGSDSLSPFPKPTQGGQLKTSGIYAQMRHPMYTSVLCLMLGLAIATNSADRLILTGILWYLLEVKSDKEEDFLQERYGNEYTQYQTAVPEKFLPLGLLELLPWTKN